MPEASAEWVGEVREGLLASPKRLPAHWLYDERGSALFEQITELPEYYLTRLELALFRRHADEMAESIGPGSTTVVELGAGSARKSGLLIEALLRRGRATYVAIDVSPTALQAAAWSLARRFPALEVRCIPARYEAGLAALASRPGRKWVLFIGSSIGNLEHPQAVALLRGISAHLAAADALLVGTDLRKELGVLLPAYDDAAGVTARFNLNVLERINRELGGHFVLSRFRHRVLWNEGASRIEMHLESLEDQSVAVDALGLDLSLRRGETIHTESSTKYTWPMLEQLFTEAGLVWVRSWTDEREWFADHLLRKGLPL